MVEFVFSVINSVVSLKLAPQIPKTKARKINVNAIGKPIKITNSMAVSMINPMVALSMFGRADMMSENHSPPGTRSGWNIARLSHNSPIT